MSGVYETCICVVSAKFSAYFAEFMQILLFVPVQIAYRNSFNYNQYLNNNTILIWLGCVCVHIFIKRENAIYLLISSQQNNSFVCVCLLGAMYLF